MTRLSWRSFSYGSALNCHAIVRCRNLCLSWTKGTESKMKSLETAKRSRGSPFSMLPLFHWTKKRHVHSGCHKHLECWRQGAQHCLLHYLCAYSATALTTKKNVHLLLLHSQSSLFSPSQMEELVPSKTFSLLTIGLCYPNHYTESFPIILLLFLRFTFYFEINYKAILAKLFLLFM